MIDRLLATASLAAVALIVTAPLWPSFFVGFRIRAIAVTVISSTASDLRASPPWLDVPVGWFASAIVCLCRPAIRALERPRLD